MKKILTSLGIIAVVATVAVGATMSQFSDTEATIGTFNTGTIDIAIDGENPWTKTYTTGELKPGETGYINFEIENVGENPVEVSKNLSGWVKSTGSQQYPCDGVPEGVSSEPECEAAQANSNTDLNNVQSKIIYDLYVEVFKNSSDTEPIWWQDIYTDDEGKTLSQVYPNKNTYVTLGTIPVNGYMKVKQSYHFSGNAGNIYQGDTLSFNMTIRGDQLPDEIGKATVVLENKTGPENWDILQDDNFQGTLTYKVQGPTFDYEFSGVAPLSNHNYVLAVGYDANTDVDTEIGTGLSDGTGNISISGSVNTGDLVNAKVWLVPAENWTGSGMDWTGGAGWPGVVPNFLWETALINYNDTD